MFRYQFSMQRFAEIWLVTRWLAEETWDSNFVTATFIRPALLGEREADIDGGGNSASGLFQYPINVFFLYGQDMAMGQNLGPLSHRFLMMFVDVGSKIRSKLHFLVVWPIPAHRPGVLPEVFSILKQKRVSSKFIEFWQARSSLFCSCICCMKFATDSLIFLPFSSTDSWLFRRWKRWIGVVP